MFCLLCALLRFFLYWPFCHGAFKIVLTTQEYLFLESLQFILLLLTCLSLCTKILTMSQTILIHRMAIFSKDQPFFASWFNLLLNRYVRECKVVTCTQNYLSSLIRMGIF